MEIKHDTVFKVAPNCDNYIHKSALRKLADEMEADIDTAESAGAVEVALTIGYWKIKIDAMIKDG